jgi:uncharacterized membrane protein
MTDETESKDAAPEAAAESAAPESAAPDAAAPDAAATGSADGSAEGEGATIVTGVVADEKGVLAEGAVAVEGDHALVVARFADRDAAISIYDSLLMSELDGSLHIDGVLVVKADQDGRIHVQKMTDHSTRTGLKWGIVGGIAAAVFLPATLLAGAVALGTAGAAAGKARNLKRRLDVEKSLKDTITPGTSGILALVHAEDAPDVRLKMPGAEAVETVPVDDETAAPRRKRHRLRRASDPRAPVGRTEVGSTCGPELDREVRAATFGPPVLAACSSAPLRTSESCGSTRLGGHLRPIAHGVCGRSVRNRTSGRIRPVSTSRVGQMNTCRASRGWMHAPPPKSASKLLTPPAVLASGVESTARLPSGSPSRGHACTSCNATDAAPR